MGILLRDQLDNVLVGFIAKIVNGAGSSMAFGFNIERNGDISLEEGWNKATVASVYLTYDRSRNVVEAFYTPVYNEEATIELIERKTIELNCVTPWHYCEVLATAIYRLYLLIEKGAYAV